MAANRPVKIRLETDEHVEVGKTTVVNVRLLDAHNADAPTPENIFLSINVRWPSGKVDAFIVPIAQGNARGQFQFTMKKPGICQLDVSEAHMAAGTAFILGTEVPMPSPVSDPPKKTMMRPMRMARAPVFRSGPDGAVISVGAATESDIQHGTASAIQFCAPTHTVLADERDSAEIRVFLLRPGGLENDATINLFSSMGSLAPSILTIPKGSISATIKLASKDTGTAVVQMPSSDPTMMPVGAMPAVHFVHAVTALDCAVSPPSISLIDHSQVVVRLLNENGNPAPSDAGQDVTLTIDNGRGELEKSTLRIPAGAYECRTNFSPTSIGAVQISGSTLGLPIEHADIHVTWPIAQLVFSLVGGLAGGFIAKLRQKYQHWRVLIGVVTGFLLYWAFIFGLLHVLPRGAALNPLSAFALSAIGGWQGTQVFSTLLSQLGLAKKST
ncbi:MAG: hypothetical protein JSS75_04495 [Bacteroidetes bacterium]|nr:hypothetical protein [Bacteroidota bacterium]